MAKNNNRNNNSKRSNKSKIVTSVKQGYNTGEVIDRASSIVKDARNQYANLNFSYYPGSPLLRDMSAGAPINAVPTLVKAEFIPTIGAYGTNGASPINQATTQLFAKIRSVNAGSVNYSAADLMVFAMSMKSLYSFHAWMTRVLSIVNWYSGKDWNVPFQFYQALNVDIKDIRKHRKDFAGYISQFALDANTLSVPDVFPIIKEESALCANIYMNDESNNMGQYIMFDPEGFYRYEENVSSGTKFGTLQWEAFPNSNMTYDDIVEYGDTLLRDARNSQDHYIMCGDIRKAFDANLVQLDSVDVDHELIPVYDKEVLDQLHNATIFAISNVSPITQDGTTETIYQNLVASAGAGTHPYPYVLDSVDWDPDPDKVSSLTRWITVVDNAHAVIACGPEILTRLTLYAATGTNNEFTELPFVQSEVVDSNSLENVLSDMSVRTLFGNHLPFQHRFVVGSGTTTDYLFGKPRCATIITATQIANINRVHFYQLFGIGSF